MEYFLDIADNAGRTRKGRFAELAVTDTGSGSDSLASERA